MKKKSVIFLTAVCLAVLAGLTSCENFLKGADIKRQLEDQIAYANAASCTIYISAPEGTGSFLSAGEKECRVGYSTELQFTVNAQNYIFKGMKAVSSKDNSQSRNDYVQITTTPLLEKQDTYKIIVKLLKTASDILIIPDCVLIPKITSVYPPQNNTSYPQDSSIKIYFNKAINLSDFADQDGFLKNMTITTGTQDLLDTQNGKIPYYKSPYLDDEGKTLVIPVVGGKYLITEENADQVKDIKVTLQLAGLKDGVKGENASFSQNEYIFTYTINGTKDSTPPEILTPFVYAQTKDKVMSQFASDHFLKQSYYDYADPAKCTLSPGITDPVEQAKLNIEQNVAGDYIWIYGKVRDSQSGISKIVVEEKLVRSIIYESGGYSINDYDFSYPVLNTINVNPEICTISDNDVLFCFKYKINTNDEGTIRLSFSVWDYANNNTSCGTLDLILVRKAKGGITISIKKENENDALKTQDLKVYCLYSTPDITGVWGNYDALLVNVNSIDGIVLKYKFKDLLFSTDGINYESGKDLISGTCRKAYAIYSYILNAGYAFYKRMNYEQDLYIKAIFENTVGSQFIKEIILPGSDTEIINITADSNLTVTTSKETQNEFSIQYKKDGSDNYVSAGSMTSLHQTFENVNLEDGNYTFCLLEEVTLPYTMLSSFSKKNIDNFTPYGSNQAIQTQAENIFIGGRSKAYRFFKGNNSGIEIPDENKIPLANQFTVTAKPNYGNTATHTLQISYTDDFAEDSNLQYFVNYNGIYTTKKEFSVPSKTAYNVSIVARNAGGGQRESTAKTVQTSEDTIAPVVGTDGSFSANPMPNMWYSYMSISEPSGLNENVEYWYLDSDSYTYEDLKNFESYTTKMNSKKEIWFKYYYGSKKYLYAKIMDKKGNFTIAKPLKGIFIGSIDSMPEISITKENDKYYLTAVQDSNPDIYISYDYLSDKNTWYRSPSAISSSVDMETLNERVFIRIYKSSGGEGGGGSKRNYSGCIYLCPKYWTELGAPQNIVKNVVQTNFGLTIFCDTYTMSHTMVSKTDLGNDYYQWEKNGVIFNTYLSEKSYNYEIPLDEIKKGYFYTVITHFADGTVLMTDVKQK